METENPYQSPSSDTHPIGQDAKPSAPSGFRAFVVLGAIVGLAIGSGIYAIRCIVEGFYLADLVRDTLVGLSVGMMVGILWGAYRRVRPRVIVGSPEQTEDGRPT